MVGCILPLICSVKFHRFRSQLVVCFTFPSRKGDHICNGQCENPRYFIIYKITGFRALEPLGWAGTPRMPWNTHGTFWIQNSWFFNNKENAYMNTWMLSTWIELLCWRSPDRLESQVNYIYEQRVRPSSPRRLSVRCILSSWFASCVLWPPPRYCCDVCKEYTNFSCYAFAVYWCVHNFVGGLSRSEHGWSCKHMSHGLNSKDSGIVSLMLLL